MEDPLGVSGTCVCVCVRVCVCLPLNGSANFPLVLSEPGRGVVVCFCCRRRRGPWFGPVWRSLVPLVSVWCGVPGVVVCGAQLLFGRLLVILYLRSWYVAFYFVFAVVVGCCFFVLTVVVCCLLICICMRSFVGCFVFACRGIRGGAQSGRVTHPLVPVEITLWVSGILGLFCTLSLSVSLSLSLFPSALCGFLACVICRSSCLFSGRWRSHSVAVVVPRPGSGGCGFVLVCCLQW